MLQNKYSSLLVNGNLVTKELLSKMNEEEFACGSAVIEQKDNCNHLSEPEFERVCNEVLDKYERPKRIIYVKKIPLTETGKICRAELSNLKN